MRDKLREIKERDYWCYGLSLDDFDWTFDLARRLVDAHITLFRQEAAEARRTSVLPPDILDEALSDTGYYTYVDTEYVWHFCLWRLQGILEGLIVSRFLPSQLPGLRGLRAKLEAMRAASYTLSTDDYDELLAWSKLRNALSHAPPERVRPGPLEQADVLEYKDFAKKVCLLWQQEHESRSKAGQP